MNAVIYHCCDRRRRDAVAAHATLNGIDYLEVLDNDAPADSPRQQTLLVHLLKPVPGLQVENLRIEGGERIRGIGVSWVAPASAPPTGVSAAEQAFFTGLEGADRILLVRTDQAGDFSRYRLRLLADPAAEEPPAGFDPQLSEVEFAFKVECPSDFDCASLPPPPLPTPWDPDIDYLARDYASLRTLLLDRISSQAPDWQGRSAADQGVALTELLAYVGDHLSYQQDAITTEAYLDTARRRTSLARHGVLVDYAVDNGCNARAWVQVQVTDDDVPVAKENTRLFTRVTGLPSRFAPGSRDEVLALESGATIFEPLHDSLLQAAHNRMAFYTWGDRACCLPKGATRATLKGHFPKLQAGDVLVFQTELDPATGQPGDADPSQRHAVRLKQVRHSRGGAPLTDPLTEQQITEIHWHGEDRLPFSLCLSSVTDEDHGAEPLDEVSIVLGNIVLVDHGHTQAQENLGQVPEISAWYADAGDSGCDGSGRGGISEQATCQRQSPEPVMPRFRPRLAAGPLTWTATVLVTGDTPHALSQRQPFDPAGAASTAVDGSGGAIFPAMTVTEISATPPRTWQPRRDLLASGAADRDFVVEVETDGIASLRFGDDRLGKRPNGGDQFTARYRIGNGIAGNVGADTLRHIACVDPRIGAVSNPLAARGGRDPETLTQIRRRAPQAFRTQQRAVTPADYEARISADPAVQQTAATLRWTGSWHTLFATVDPLVSSLSARAGSMSETVPGTIPGTTAEANNPATGERLEPELKKRLLQQIEPYRLAGHEVALDGPVYVSLEIGLTVCVAADYFRGQVRAALLNRLSNRDLPGGDRGLFHPDNFTFGQTVYLSPIYGAVRSLPGVAGVTVTRFQQQGREDDQYLAAGEMHLGGRQIARLDNDPNFPERGVLHLTLQGGK